MWMLNSCPRISEAYSKKLLDKETYYVGSHLISKLHACGSAPINLNKMTKKVEI